MITLILIFAIIQFEMGIPINYYSFPNEKIKYEANVVVIIKETTVQIVDKTNMTYLSYKVDDYIEATHTYRLILTYSTIPDTEIGQIAFLTVKEEEIWYYTVKTNIIFYINSPELLIRVTPQTYKL